MSNKEWIKPAISGAAVGAIALGVIGFNWIGWMTASKAGVMASEQSRAAVTEALLPLCVSQAKSAANFDDALAELKVVTSYQREEFVANQGWATLPGAEHANRNVARACGDTLAG